jgi:hypothetical protein
MPVPEDYWSEWEPRPYQAADRRQTIVVLFVRLDFQVALAAMGFGVTLLLLRLAKRGRYRLAIATLALAVLMFAAWALFLDAATHGWSDLPLA